MRNDLNTRTPETPGNSRAKKTSAKQDPASAGVSGLGSDEARRQVRVHGLEAAASSTPEMRQHKVAALQNAIANGTYDVGARQIADAIIDHLQQDDSVLR